MHRHGCRLVVLVRSPSALVLHQHTRACQVGDPMHMPALADGGCRCNSKRAGEMIDGLSDAAMMGCASLCAWRAAAWQMGF